MKVYVRAHKREAPVTDQLIIDVSGLADWEVRDFVEMIKERVSIKKPKKKCKPSYYDDECIVQREDRKTIDINVNINRD